MPANWTAIEDVFYDWAASESALSVIWENQNTAQPTGNYVTLRMDTNVAVGQSIESVIEREDADPGEEIEVRRSSTRECSLVVDAFSAETIGASSAHRVLERLQMSLEKTSVRETFGTAGFTLIDYGSIQSIPQLFAADIQGRATMRLRFYVIDDVSEYTGFIETADLVDLTVDDEITI